MFTPEREVPSSRFRESTPKTPKEKEFPSSRFKESTPRTPIFKNRVLPPLYEEMWKNVELSRSKINEHIMDAIKEQQNVLIQLQNGIETAEEYDEKTESEELTGLLKTENVKYQQIVSLLNTIPTRSQIVPSYGLF